MCCSAGQRRKETQSKKTHAGAHCIVITQECCGILRCVTSRIKREQGKKDTRGQPHSQPRVKSEIRYSEVKKGKIIEATGKRENLRKSG